MRYCLRYIRKPRRCQCTLARHGIMVIGREVEARNSNGRRNKQIREGEPKGTSNNMCFTLYQIPFLGTFFEVPECVTGDREGLTPPIVGAISLGPRICMRDNWMSCLDEGKKNHPLPCPAYQIQAETSRVSTQPTRE